MDFFQQHLVSPSARSYFAQLAGVERSDAETIIRHHLGVCFDICHHAVQFENPVESLKTLKSAGIRVCRIQLSSAVDLAIRGTLQQNLERLRRFNEKVYLHQVVETGGGEPAPVRRFCDLPQAIASLTNEGNDPRPRRWRIHFHLPLFLAGTDDFGTTQPEVADVLQWLARGGGCSNLEVETYTWDVLPPALKTGDRVSDIAREMDWVVDQLGAGGEPHFSGWSAG